MNIQLYLVDFPTSKEKFWQSYIKQAHVQPISRTMINFTQEFKAENIYLFYIQDNNHLKEVEKNISSIQSDDFRFALLFADQDTYTQNNSKYITSNEKLLLVSIDDAQLNIGNITTLNYIAKLHARDITISHKFKNKIQELSTQFDVAIERLEKQLMLARQKFFNKDHSKPIKFNAIQFDYTYRAGNKPGTEYSDFIFWGEWALWLNFSSTSYAEASVLLKFVEDCRKEKDYWKDTKLNDIHLLFRKTIQDFENVMNHKVMADYFICLVNAKNKSADYIVKGSYECLDSKGRQWPIDTDGIKVFHKVFSPGEKFLMLTPGLYRNIMNESKKNSLKNFVKDNLDSLKQEILTELVLILEQDQSNFLDYDMNVVYGEIAKDGSDQK